MDRVYKTPVEPISIPCVLFARARIGFLLPRRHSRYSAGRFNRYSSMCVWGGLLLKTLRQLALTSLLTQAALSSLCDLWAPRRREGELAAPDGRGGCQPPKWRRRERRRDEKKSDRSAARGNARSRLLTVVWISPVVRFCSVFVVVVVVFKKAGGGRTCDTLFPGMCRYHLAQLCRTLGSRKRSWNCFGQWWRM